VIDRNQKRKRKMIVHAYLEPSDNAGTVMRLLGQRLNINHYWSNYWNECIGGKDTIVLRCEGMCELNGSNGERDFAERTAIAIWHEVGGYRVVYVMAECPDTNTSEPVVMKSCYVLGKELFMRQFPSLPVPA